VTHSSGDQYNFGGVTGNVAAGSSDVTQNYNAGFDITKERVRLGCGVRSSRTGSSRP
jgi:hypothetical protein